MIGIGDDDGAHVMAQPDSAEVFAGRFPLDSVSSLVSSLINKLDTCEDINSGGTLFAKFNALACV